MADDTPADLLIMLEIVKYLQVRVERQGSSAADPFALAEIFKNLPPGVTIGSLVTNQSNQIQEAVMGDRYEVGQAGAVGPQSVAVGQHFHQVWNKMSSEIDLQQLVEELTKLREKARASASGTPEEDLALAELAGAQLAAEQGDGSRALGHLARAGQWALNMAQQIGVPIAIKALESAMGVSVWPSSSDPVIKHESWSRWPVRMYLAPPTGSDSPIRGPVIDHMIMRSPASPGRGRTVIG
jgi:hypothetical protein